MSSLGAVRILAALLLSCFWARPAAAQTPDPGATAGTPTRPSVDVVAPVPPRPGPDFGFEPAVPEAQQGAREPESYPERTRSVHAPAFVKSAVTTVRTSRTSGVRVGLSGWTAPRVPFDFRESSGGIALGLTIQWGVALPEPGLPPTAPPSGGQR
jgi:hypothetical protein